MQFKIYYFPVLGRAEILRLILEYGGAEYENKFPKDWKQEKSQTPFGQLPVLIIKDQQHEIHLAQSQAIMRFLADKFKLIPTDPLQRAFLESFVESWNEVLDKMGQIIYGTPEQVKDRAIQDIQERVLNPHLKIHQLILQGNKNSGFYMGSKTTLPDLMLFHAVTLVNKHIPQFYSREKTPEIWKVYSQIQQNSRIKEYMSSTRRLKE